MPIGILIYSKYLPASKSMRYETKGAFSLPQCPALSLSRSRSLLLLDQLLPVRQVRLSGEGDSPPPDGLVFIKISFLNFLFPPFTEAFSLVHTDKKARNFQKRILSFSATGPVTKITHKPSRDIVEKNFRPENPLPLVRAKFCANKCAQDEDDKRAERDRKKGCRDSPMQETLGLPVYPWGHWQK